MKAIKHLKADQKTDISFCMRHLSDANEPIFRQLKANFLASQKEDKDATELVDECFKLQVKEIESCLECGEEREDIKDFYLFKLHES